MYLLDQPIYIGFSGLAGSGKTSTATGLVPPINIINPKSPLSHVRDHLSLAAPIYEIVSWKRMTEGPDAKSRTMHGLHECLNELLHGYIEYDDLVELVYDIYSMYAGTVDDPKPRHFMQTVGDMCRAVYEDCFVDALCRKARTSRRSIVNDLVNANQTDEYEELPYFCFISDIRRSNELDFLRSQDNFILVRLNASFDTANSRILERDGRAMKESEWGHATETELANLDESECDLVVDTDNLTLNEQIEMVNDFIVDTFNPVLTKR